MKYNFIKINDDINAVKALYPDMDENKFNELIKLDPTYRDGSNSLGIYGKWILNLYKKGNLKEEDFYKVTEYLKDFEAKKKLIANKDINSYKILPDLAKVLEETDEPTQSKNQLRKAIKRTDLSQDAEYIGDFGNYVCYSPKTYEASCKLGANTEWCTATREDRRNYDYYSKEGKLYIFINKSTNQAEYQLHFETKSFMNRYDRKIKLYDFINNICPESKNAIIEIIKKGIKEKRLRLYDFMWIDELIEYFKEDIKKKLKFNEDDKREVRIYTSKFAEYCKEKGDADFRYGFLADAFDGDLDYWFSDNYREINDIEEYKKYVNDKNLNQLKEYKLKYENINGLDIFINNGIKNGNINQCLEDVELALDNAFKKIGASSIYDHDEDSFEVNISFDNYYNLIKQSYKDEDFMVEFQYDDFFPEEIQEILMYWASCFFKLREPRYGWIGDFDKETFNEEIEEWLDNIELFKIDDSYKPLFDDEEDYQRWERWFRINILDEEDIAEGQEQFELGDSMKYKFKDKKDLEYVYKLGFVYKDKNGNLKRKDTYEIKNYYENKYLGKGKYTKAQIYYMIQNADVDCDNYIVLHKNDKEEEIPQTKKGYKNMDKQEFINYLINSGYSDVDAEEKANVYYD